MKSFTIITRWLVVGVAACLWHSNPASAQIPGAGTGAATMNASMVRLFGANTNFIAKAEARVVDKNQREATSMVMGFEMLSGKIRVDVNMANVKSREMPPEFVASMTKLGMGEMSTILLPDQKIIISIYPGLKAYAQSPMPKEDVEASAKTFKIEKTRLGKESIDGHPCEKDTVTLTDAAGIKDRVTVWYATDLKDFPVQMQIPADDSMLTMKFKDVKLGRPETSRFQAPVGLAKFDSVNALMFDAVNKKAKSGAAK